MGFLEGRYAKRNNFKACRVVFDVNSRPETESNSSGKLKVLHSKYALFYHYDYPPPSISFSY